MEQPAKLLNVGSSPTPTSNFMKRTYRKYTKELLDAAVSSSISIAEAMRKCGFTNVVGGGHTHFSKMVKKFEVSTDHLLGQRANSGARKKGGSKKKTAAEILVFHPDGKRNHASQLRRGLDEIGRPRQCAGCGIKDWQGKTLVLEVEHRDGDFQNDAAENLEYLCPNCHSQTETYSNYQRSGRLGKLANPSRLEREVSGFESQVAYQSLQ